MIKEKIEKEFSLELIETSDNWKALCPFHDEITPSFYIHQTQLICHCFGCGIAGSLETLLAKKLKISRQDAKERLGITLTRREAVVKDKFPKRYPESWLANWPPTYSTFLYDRYISEQTAKSFDARWDRKTRRVVFPLREHKTAILVGAAGRALFSEPKWYFYWGCSKSANIFLAKSKVQKKLFIVEGILDALRLYDLGLNAAALLGSKASKQQLAQILQESSNVVLALDNDDAGRMGNSDLERKLRKSCSIEYLRYPSSWIKDVGDFAPDELEDSLKRLISPLEYKLEFAVH